MSNTATRDAYYSVAQTAKRLRVSPSTIWRWIEAGKLTAYRVGPKTIRIRIEDLEQVIQPARAGGKELDAVAIRGEPPPEEELRRRQALVKEILKNRQQRRIAPLTSSDLIAMVREGERQGYGQPR